jgi:hypothetical protein
MMASRQGQMPMRSAFGQGMCQKVMMVARGRRSRIMLRREGEVVVLHEHDGVVAVDLARTRLRRIFGSLGRSAPSLRRGTPGRAWATWQSGQSPSLEKP